MRFFLPFLVFYGLLATQPNATASTVHEHPNLKSYPVIHRDSLPAEPEMDKAAAAAGYLAGGSILMALVAALAPEAAAVLLAISFLLGLFGFIAGIKALKRIRKSLIKKAGLGFAIFGIVVGGLWLLYAAFIIILIGVLIAILFSH